MYFWSILKMLLNIVEGVGIYSGFLLGIFALIYRPKDKYPLNPFLNSILFCDENQ